MVRCRLPVRLYHVRNHLLAMAMRVSVAILSALALFGHVCTQIGCARWSVPNEEVVCSRWVGSDGHLYGRTVITSTAALKSWLRPTWSHPGRCVDGAQGLPNRIVVCLVASSPCAHDRTSKIFPDEKEKYFERYPGSYDGACEEEKPDECLRHMSTYWEYEK